MGGGRENQRINCHHNFSQLEKHDGMAVWVTRKGAIRAGPGDLGLIPGSMGQRSYVIGGKGNPLSYESCAHGAGRRLSRRKARQTLSIESLTDIMGGRAWQTESGERLLDEHPHAYKDLDRVMADQSDLVGVVHTLSGIANYKGVS
jgi:tRNA-splicing ligase RtcB